MALMPDNQRGQLRALGVLVLLAGAAAFYLYVYTPGADELTELEDRIAQVQQQNDMAEARTTRLDETRAELERTERLFRALRDLVPDRTEATRIYESLATRTEDMGLEMVSVVPAEPDPAGDGYYLQQQWDMTVEGGYHDVGRFLTEVASSERLVRPQVSSLTPVGSTGEGGELEVRAVFALETFVLAPDSARSEGEGGTGGS